ncbi:transcriptional regulator [Microbispora rosea subsp. aerata]|nr:metalloregulator ArsR/SmtB family transcription factor [Microbispora rosea]GGO08339.1 transcriptional regulator [Microbispora rosea subsp. aerata]GIH55428.1 transcriptional regulator [Microbispora rosea subsp. aerata]GLJ84625.1 transcriptional regulator [Microbispora rosea subsp. aerata]
MSPTGTAASGAAEPHRDRGERAAEPDIARAAALIADPSRARILKALGDGRALPSSMLAAEAGVSAPTVSEHLRKLVEAGLVRVERHGRHRYHRLAGPEVSTALEALAVIAPPSRITGLRDSSRASALSRSRTCYDHLAGRLGVALMRALLRRGLLEGHDGVHRPALTVRDRPASYGHDYSYRVTEHGRRELSRFGVRFDRLPARRPLVRYCVDWSEHQHHLAGALGAAITGRLFELGWLRPGSAPRVVHLTEAGAAGLRREFDLADY